MAKAKPLEVHPYDGPFRCLVSSERNPNRVYLVDLEEYDGVGFCGCTDFATRKQPELEKLTGLERWRTRKRWYCKHIKAVRGWLASQYLDGLLRERARAKKL